MKNLFFTLALVLISSSVFANTKEVKKEVSKQTTTQTNKVVKEASIKVYCDGVYKGTISCDGCSASQIANAAIAMCN